MTNAHSRRVRRSRPAASGFTLVELMIVVAIIGMLATLAIPNFLKFQLKSKTGEVKTNLSALRVVEEAYFTEYGVYVAANPEPAAVPGRTSGPFDLAGSDFAVLGWAPDGQVYFSYAVGLTANSVGYTVDAAADMDGDTTNQFWGYKKADRAGNFAASTLGCDITQLPTQTVAPCGGGSGQTVF